MKTTALMAASSAVALCAGLETRDEGGDDPLAQATRAVEELRSANETFRTEQTAAAERHATEVRGLTDRIAGLETRLNRPGGGGTQQPNEPTIEVRAFTGFIRNGREALGADEVRALRTDVQVAGGYLAPDQFEAILLRELVQVSPVRQASRVTPVSSGALILPKRIGRIAAKWVGEVEERPGTEPTYGQIEIPVHEMACWVDVSNRLLEDAAVNIENELAIDFAEEFGRLEASAFMVGNGIKKPVGVLADPNVKAIPAAAAKIVGYDDILAMFYGIPQAYRSRAVWMLSPSLMVSARKMQDPEGHYIWSQGGNASITDAPPETLLGRPGYEAPELAEAGSDPDVPYGVFGDLASAYRILDRGGLSVLRDPYTQQTNGIVRFHARRRVGGGVVRPEAVVKLVKPKA